MRFCIIRKSRDAYVGCPIKSDIINVFSSSFCRVFKMCRLAGRPKSFKESQEIPLTSPQFISFCAFSKNGAFRLFLKIGVTSPYLSLSLLFNLKPAEPKKHPSQSLLNSPGAFFVQLAQVWSWLHWMPATACILQAWLAKFASKFISLPAYQEHFPKLGLPRSWVPMYNVRTSLTAIKAPSSESPLNNLTAPTNATVFTNEPSDWSNNNLASVFRMFNLFLTPFSSASSFWTM